MKACNLAAILVVVMGNFIWPASAYSQAGVPVQVVAANSIESLDVSQQGGTIYLRVALKGALQAPPASFSVANPARIAFDFPGTANGLGRILQNIEEGDLRSANIVQVGDRTRLVLNLVKIVPYETRVDGNTVLIALNPKGSEASVSSPAASPIFASTSQAVPVATSTTAKGIRDINFRRGKDGEARIVVDLSNPDTAIDIQRRGGNLIVDFIRTALPEHLRKRSDVTDFATPVSSMVVQSQGENVRLTVAPNGQWEHNAYQSDNQFVLEVRKLVEDPNKLVQGGRGQFQGEKLSLNFQDVDVRSVLQVIADFTNFNIITSDTVKGNLTLRLKDVPWDQALDIILQAKGLDMRKNGNVIWIAPRDELAARDKLQLESLAQIGDLEPLQTESFQINYHKAKDIFDFLKTKDQTVLSKRGSVIVDERSNKVFVTDVTLRLQDLRKLISEIDIPPRQVLIEARIVEADKGFSRDLGVRLNFLKTNANGATPGGGRVAIGEASTTGLDPVVGGGTLALALYNKSATRLLELELTALETDNRGRVVSSPRVLTANQVEAVIEQGTEVPYQQASSSGATAVSFKKAVLALKVKPQITPDGRVQLFVDVNKDSVGDAVAGVPSINTKHVKTEVMVDNGGTVVLGGIYEETERTDIDRIPLLGELPVIGALFRNTTRTVDRKELLVFLTPRIAADALTLR